jgi:hypothetical protein
LCQHSSSLLVPLPRLLAHLLPPRLLPAHPLLLA